MILSREGPGTCTILCIVNVEDSFAIAHTECRKYCIFVPGGDVTLQCTVCSLCGRVYVATRIFHTAHV